MSDVTEFNTLCPVLLCLVSQIFLYHYSNKRCDNTYLAHEAKVAHTPTVG